MRRMTLKEFRDFCGYTQKQLAKKFGVTHVTMSNLENANVNFSGKMRRRYMENFDLIPDEVELMWQLTLREKHKRKGRGEI